MTIQRDGDVSYKRITESDLADKIMPIELKAYSHPWTESIFASCLSGSYEAWMMLQNRKVLGYGVISAYSGEGHLLNLCVNPTCQGKGLGRQLLAYLVAKVKQLGASVLFLEVRSSNVAAIELYYSEGFNELAVRKGYYPSANGREDALLMSLELSIDDYC